MKKLIPILLFVLAIGFSGCTTTEIEEVAEDVVDTSEVVTIVDQIEDFDNYIPLEGDEKPTFLAGCDFFVDFMTEIHEGEMGRLSLGEGEYPIVLYSTENPYGWDTDEFKEFNQCIDGVGVAGPLKAYEGHLLWGYPNCSAGWAPDEDDRRYDDFQACLEVEAEVDAYLE